MLPLSALIAIFKSPLHSIVYIFLLSIIFIAKNLFINLLISNYKLEVFLETPY